LKSVLPEVDVFIAQLSKRVPISLDLPKTKRKIEIRCERKNFCLRSVTFGQKCILPIFSFSVFVVTVSSQLFIGEKDEEYFILAPQHSAHRHSA
jgi:hypothetical protein